MEEVVEAFMNRGDEEGLQKLYEITKDELVDILLSWYNTYDRIKESCESNEFYMYDDLFQYVWNKYNLGEE